MNLTPTQRRIYDALSDGAKLAEKLRDACCDDDLTDVATVRVHIHALRKRLPAGQQIATIQRGGKTWYLLTRATLDA